MAAESHQRRHRRCELGMKANQSKAQPKPKVNQMSCGG